MFLATQRAGDHHPLAGNVAPRRQAGAAALRGQTWLHGRRRRRSSLTGHKIVPTPRGPGAPSRRLRADLLNRPATTRAARSEANKPDGDYLPRAARGTAALTSPRVPRAPAPALSRQSAAR